MIKDRINCPNCGKEVLSQNGESVSKCPHCGGWIPIVKWESREDLDNFMSSIKNEIDKSGKKEGKKKFSLKSLFKK
jgi:DNA-directed RNA polymerase subunit RPC12/RpoP